MKTKIMGVLKYKKILNTMDEHNKSGRSKETLYE